MAANKSYPSWTPTTKQYANLLMHEIADYNYGETLTHEDYNYWLNKLSEYDRYNNQVLENLFTESDEGSVFRIPYIDKKLVELQRLSTDNYNDIRQAEEDIADLENLTTRILDGSQIVGHAKIADKIEGVDTVGPLRYYGTSKENAVGFHELPPMVYTERIDQARSVNVDGIFFVPSLNSVDETMLTPALRAKINGTSYAAATPVTLQAPVAVAPVDTSNFITDIPEDVVRRSELEAYLKVTTFQENANTIVNESNNYSDEIKLYLSNLLDEFKEEVRANITRIYINEIPGKPRKGDIVVML